MLACAVLALGAGWVIDRWLIDDDAESWGGWDVMELAALVAATVLAVGALGVVVPVP